MLAEASVASGRLSVPDDWFHINSSNVIQLKFNKHEKYLAVNGFIIR